MCDLVKDKEIFSISLFEHIYKYSLINHSKISSFEWDINVENFYEEEKEKFINELNKIVDEHEHDCMVTIHNIGKYWERLHKQSNIKKEIETRKELKKLVKSIEYPDNKFESEEEEEEEFKDIDFDEEYDRELGYLDTEVIPGYEPEETPKFEIKGYVIPETYNQLGTKSRKSKDKLSHYNDFKLLLSHQDVPKTFEEELEDKKEKIIKLEKELRKLERKNGRKTKNKLMKKEKLISTSITLSDKNNNNDLNLIPNSNLSTITLNNIIVDIPKKSKLGRPVGSKNKPKDTVIVPSEQKKKGRPPGSKNKPKVSVPPTLISEQVSIVEIPQEKEQKKRGRPLGSKNKKATAKTDRDVIIYDKEIIFSQKPSNFEKYVIQYSRKNRDVCVAEWDHKINREFEKLHNPLKKLVKELISKWMDINGSVIGEFREYLKKNIKNGELSAKCKNIVNDFITNTNKSIFEIVEEEDIEYNDENYSTEEDIKYVDTVENIIYINNNTDSYHKDGSTLDLNKNRIDTDSNIKHSNEDLLNLDKNVIDDNKYVLYENKNYIDSDPNIEVLNLNNNSTLYENIGYHNKLSIDLDNDSNNNEYIENNLTAKQDIIDSNLDIYLYNVITIDNLSTNENIYSNDNNIKVCNKDNSYINLDIVENICNGENNYINLNDFNIDDQYIILDIINNENKEVNKNSNYRGIHEKLNKIIKSSNSLNLDVEAINTFSIINEGVNKKMINSNVVKDSNYFVINDKLNKIVNPDNGINLNIQLADINEDNELNIQLINIIYEGEKIFDLNKINIIDDKYNICDENNYLKQNINNISGVNDRQYEFQIS